MGPVGVRNASTLLYGWTFGAQPIGAATEVHVFDEGMLSHNERQSGGGVGTWIALRMSFASPGIWWGPLWAALCGAVAGGVLSADPGQALRLVVVLALADPIVGNLSHLALGCDRMGAPTRPMHESGSPAVPALPYIRPGSPGDRVGRWLQHAVGWPKDDADSQVGLYIVALIILGLMLGEPALWVVLGTAGVLAAGALAQRFSAELALLLRALAESALMWGVGYAAFAPLKANSLGLAALYALAYWSVLRLLMLKATNSVPGVAVALVGMVLVPLVSKQPVLATAVALVGAFPIGASLLVREAAVGPLFVRRIRWYMLAAMLLSALSIR
jgi:hypothetical protein